MVGGGERSIVNKQFVRAIFLKRGNLQVFECVLPLKSLTHLSLSQSISLSLLESSTSVILNAEKKRFVSRHELDLLEWQWRNLVSLEAPFCVTHPSAPSGWPLTEQLGVWSSQGH